MKRIVTLLVLAICLLPIAWAQDAARPNLTLERDGGAFKVSDPAALTELEQLKGENLRLKLDSLDKQMRLMQEQYARVQEAQQQLVQQLQTLDEGIVRARALPPAAWRVNWQTGKLERTEPPRHEDTEKNK